MAREPLLGPEGITTSVCAVVGLTAWYVAQELSFALEIELIGLFGIGVILPLAINGFRRRMVYG